MLVGLQAMDPAGQRRADFSTHDCAQLRKVVRRFPVKAAVGGERAHDFSCGDTKEPPAAVAESEFSNRVLLRRSAVLARPLRKWLEKRQNFAGASRTGKVGSQRYVGHQRVSKGIWFEVGRHSEALPNLSKEEQRRRLRRGSTSEEAIGSFESDLAERRIGTIT